MALLVLVLMLLLLLLPVHTDVSFKTVATTIATLNQLPSNTAAAPIRFDDSTDLENTKTLAPLSLAVSTRPTYFFRVCKSLQIRPTERHHTSQKAAVVNTAFLFPAFGERFSVAAQQQHMCRLQYQSSTKTTDKLGEKVVNTQGGQHAKWVFRQPTHHE